MISLNIVLYLHIPMMCDQHAPPPKKKNTLYDSNRLPAFIPKYYLLQNIKISLVAKRTIHGRTLGCPMGSRLATGQLYFSSTGISVWHSHESNLIVAKLLFGMMNCTFKIVARSPRGHCRSAPSAAYVRQWICSALCQIMACRLFGANPLSEPMLVYC